MSAPLNRRQALKATAATLAASAGGIAMGSIATPRRRFNIAERPNPSFSDGTYDVDAWTDLAQQVAELELATVQRTNPHDWQRLEYVTLFTWSEYATLFSGVGTAAYSQERFGRLLASFERPGAWLNGSPLIAGWIADDGAVRPWAVFVAARWVDPTFHEAWQPAFVSGQPTRRGRLPLRQLG